MLCHFCCSCGRIADAGPISALPTAVHCEATTCHGPALTVVLHKLATNAQYMTWCLILDRKACKLAAFRQVCSLEAGFDNCPRSAWRLQGAGRVQVCRVSNRHVWQSHSRHAPPLLISVGQLPRLKPVPGHARVSPRSRS